MDFIRFIRSLEEFLYEVVTWLYLYPRTLGRIIRRPSGMAAEADAELHEADEEQFVDLVSPPLFLMLSILIAHMAEISLHAGLGQYKSALAKDVFSSEPNLLIYRSIFFAVFPLLMSVGLLSRQNRPIDRKTLRQPFFLQCYLTAPFALATSLGGLLLQMQNGAAVLAGGAVNLIAAAWYLRVQTEWFSMRLAIGRGRALAIALKLLLIGLAVGLGASLILVWPEVLERWRAVEAKG